MPLILQLILFCFIAIPAVAEETPAYKKVYISPGYWGDIFAIDNPLFNRDDCLKPIWEFQQTAAKAGYLVEQTYTLNGLSDFEYLIVFEVFPDQIEMLA